MKIKFAMLTMVLLGNAIQAAEERPQRGYAKPSKRMGINLGAFNAAQEVYYTYIKRELSSEEPNITRMFNNIEQGIRNAELRRISPLSFLEELRTMIAKSELGSPEIREQLINKLTIKISTLPSIPRATMKVGEARVIVSKISKPVARQAQELDQVKFSIKEARRLLERIEKNLQQEKAADLVREANKFTEEAYQLFTEKFTEEGKPELAQELVELLSYQEKVARMVKRQIEAAKEQAAKAKEAAEARREQERLEKAKLEAAEQQQQAKEAAEELATKVREAAERREQERLQAEKAKLEEARQEGQERLEKAKLEAAEQQQQAKEAAEGQFEAALMPKQLGAIQGQAQEIQKGFKAAVERRIKEIKADSEQRQKRIQELKEQVGQSGAQKEPVKRMIRDLEEKEKSEQEELARLEQEK